MLRKLTRIHWVTGLCLVWIASSASAQPNYADLVKWDAAYRDALERWSTGDASVVSELAAFDRRHVHAANCVRMVPLSLAEELARLDPEHLVPQLLLHEALFLLHLHASQQVEAAFQQELHQAMLDVYLDRIDLDPDDGSRELAVRLLVVPAAFALQARDWRSMEQAQVLLDRAMEIDPEHVTALRFLAQLHELDGRFRRAAQALETVRELQPDLRSPRLHLALAYLRSGRKELGRRELEHLLGGAEDWVAELAFEELVREYLRLGELDAASRSLRDGLERFPDSSELWLQSAVLHLRRGEPPPIPSEALVERWTTSSGPSPRYLFDRGPFENLDAYQARFRDANQQRFRDFRPALAQVEESAGFRPKVWEILGTKKFMGGCQGFLRKVAP